VHDLVLLRDEVALLKQSAAGGVVGGTERTLAQQIVCDYFCAEGLAERSGDDFRLTSWGDRLARKLIADGAAGTVWLLQSELDVLRGV